MNLRVAHAIRRFKDSSWLGLLQVERRLSCRRYSSLRPPKFSRYSQWTSARCLPVRVTTWGIRCTGTTSATRSPTDQVLASPWADVALSKDMNLADLILKSTTRYNQDRIAMVDTVTDHSLTYSELHEAVSMVIHGLGPIKKDDVVCLCGPNSVEMAVCLLAIPAMGAIASPINPILSQGEITRMLEDLKPSYLITTADLLPKFADVRNTRKQLKKNTFVLKSGETVQYPSIEGFITDGNAASKSVWTHSHINPTSDPAFLMFSSGTTGFPKAVQLTHYNVIANVLSLCKPEVGYLPPGHNSTVTVFPFFHVGGLIVCLYTLLYMQATQIILPKFEYKEYMQLNEKHKVTTLIMPPPVAVQMSKDPFIKNYDVSSVKVIMGGGAPISAPVQKAVSKLFMPIPFKQLYGMTEVTCISHIDHAERVKPGSAGMILPNMKSKVVDRESGEILNPSEFGEICLLGPQVMLGYAHQPEATRASIDPSGWLHTGDIGYYDEDGNLFIVDRLKDLIKYKGYQVAPAELEATILTHPDVVEAAVVGVEDEMAGEIPRAYVILRPGVDPGLATQDIKQFVQERVAPYKQLRGGVWVIDAIPKLPSGKILRRQLRQMVPQD